MRSDHLAGVTVAVCLDKQDAREYETGTSSTKDNTTITYIENVPETNFTVEVRFDSSFGYPEDDVHIRLSLDGHAIATKMSYSSKRVDVIFKGITHEFDGEMTHRRFKFAKLITSKCQSFSELYTSSGLTYMLAEEPVDPWLKSRLAKIGDIDVRLLRCCVTGSSDQWRCDERPSFAEEGVPEKALKGQAISTYAT
jgi:hypothetical protein